MDDQKELAAAQEQMARLARDRKHLEALRRQERDCRHALESLGEAWRREQRDVDRLEGLTWSSVLARLRGCREERLEKELAEAYAAQLRYQAGERQLAEIQQELLDCQGRVQANQGCEARYDALLREKQAELKRRNPALAEQIREMEQGITQAMALERELEEAVSAGEQALRQLDGVLDSLGSAESWGTWDLFSDSIFTDVIKYSRLDEAQQKIAVLRGALRRYQAELADVEQAGCFDVHPGGLLWAADVFLDNIFTDWAVLDRIQASQEEMTRMWRQLKRQQRRLEERLGQCRTALRQQREELDTLVREA